MGRKSLKEPRQKEIIKAFYKIVKKDGLENASIQKIAESIQINPSLIMHYFRSREHLVYGLVEFILDRWLLIFDVKDAEDPRDALDKVLDNIFSKKWNSLFDDGTSYSLYSLAFRNKTIRQRYKHLLDSLRQRLSEMIEACNESKTLAVKDPVATADIIFVLVDGAYYYLSLVDDKAEYDRRLAVYKKHALNVLC
ncbi:TetR family transcriptional regulator [Chitinophaga rhizosphaerae]|uniref:TetR family transcriptional regulator n=1 Tax=Chitinophaga rhizosphaerae TaxID=1864947 RepID=UPI000F80F044|nr:TetR family transcriptional regulator [Chitinophaga rhizosphaerae]